jgi:3alpha(or 20beta)-hydroxysteroid dehydrogenase
MPTALVQDQTMTGAAIPAPGLLGDLGLRGAAVIVTGASSGIGAATATALGTAGASVVLVGRRRIGQADEVARWIAFLLSPVSSFMTGAVIPLDGGQVIHRV